MRMSEEARALVEVGAEIARFRGAPRVTTLDIALAFVLIDARPRGQLFPDVNASPSPTMLEFAPALHELLSSAGELGLDDLRRATEPVRQAVSHALIVENA